jgi:1-acyl-sn-glycerol-3-phosphate acyltransferase
VAETRATRAEEYRRIETDIIRSVDAALGIPPDKVQLVSPHCIPKTSSGKIRRQETRALFERGELEARKRPPWLQIVRLWTENFGSWAQLGLRRAAEWLERSYASATLVAASAAAGTAARLAPRSRALHWGARCFLWLGGHRIDVHGAADLNLDGPSVLVANRAGRVDALVLAAAIPSPLLLADSGALSSLPPAASALLSPLVVPPVPGETAPPGGTMKQRIRQALEGGFSVAVFAEGRIGEAPHLSRFRLDAFHAAVETSTPVRPIALAGTSHLLGGHPALRKKARVVLGDPLFPEAREHREIVRLRDRVREQIGNLVI